MKPNEYATSSTSAPVPGTSAQLKSNTSTTTTSTKTTAMLSSTDTRPFESMILTRATAAIIHNIGFESANESCINALSSMMENFFQILCRTSMNYCNHANRTRLCLSDVSRSFDENGISLTELHDYIREVSPFSTGLKVPHFPVPECRVPDNEDVNAETNKDVNEKAVDNVPSEKISTSQPLRPFPNFAEQSAELLGFNVVELPELLKTQQNERLRTFRQAEFADDEPMEVDMVLKQEYEDFSTRESINVATSEGHKLSERRSYEFASLETGVLTEKSPHKLKKKKKEKKEKKREKKEKRRRETIGDGSDNDPNPIVYMAEPSSAVTVRCDENLSEVVENTTISEVMMEEQNISAQPEQQLEIFEFGYNFSNQENLNCEESTIAKESITTIASSSLHESTMDFSTYPRETEQEMDELTAAPSSVVAGSDDEIGDDTMPALTIERVPKLILHNVDSQNDLSRKEKKKKSKKNKKDKEQRRLEKLERRQKRNQEADDYANPTNAEFNDEKPSTSTEEHKVPRLKIKFGGSQLMASSPWATSGDASATIASTDSVQQIHDEKFVDGDSQAPDPNSAPTTPPTISPVEMAPVEDRTETDSQLSESSSMLKSLKILVGKVKNETPNQSAGKSSKRKKGKPVKSVALVLDETPPREEDDITQTAFPDDTSHLSPPPQLAAMPLASSSLLEEANDDANELFHDESANTAISASPSSPHIQTEEPLPVLQNEENDAEEKLTQDIPEFPSCSPPPPAVCEANNEEQDESGNVKPSPKLSPLKASPQKKKSKKKSESTSSKKKKTSASSVPPLIQRRSTAETLFDDCFSSSKPRKESKPSEPQRPAQSNVATSQADESVSKKPTSKSSSAKAPISDPSPLPIKKKSSNNEELVIVPPKKDKAKIKMLFAPASASLAKKAAKPKTVEKRRPSSANLPATIPPAKRKKLDASVQKGASNSEKPPTPMVSSSAGKKTKKVSTDSEMHRSNSSMSHLENTSAGNSDGQNSASRSSNSPVDGEDENIWICPKCSVAYVDGASDMVGCDGCDSWFHWHCVGLQIAPPENKEWFCHSCTKKRKKNGTAASTSTTKKPPKGNRKKK